MDTRTLIFSLGLINIALSWAVYLYRRASQTETPLLQLWQLAKLVSGVGFILGWSRPLFSPEWMPWLHVGNLMQQVGIGIELLVYVVFFGRAHWVRPILYCMAGACLVFVVSVVFGDSPHAMIVTGTGIAALLYLSIAVLSFSARRQSPELLLLIGAFDGLLGLMLAIKTVLGLSGVHMEPYMGMTINTLVYATAIVVMCSNGFAFLLLVQQRSDRALAEALQKLASSEAAERELLRVAAHEFRTPAAIIQTSMDSLDMLDIRLSPDVQRRHDQIRQAVKRMTDLAGSLISRDRLLGQAVQPRPELISVATLLEELIASYPQTDRLQCAPCPEHWILDADPVLLQIALHNLVDNALACSAASDPVRVSVRCEPDCLVFGVVDLGPGVADDLKADIFMRRYTASGSLTRGVGLSIVAIIAQSLGGEAVVEDNPPRGSVFSIRLPYQDYRPVSQT